MWFIVGGFFLDYSVLPEWPVKTVPTAGLIRYGRFVYILTADQ